MDAASFFLNQEARKYEGACAAAAAQLRRASSMATALRVADVTPPAIIRAVCRSLPAHRKLAMALESRLEALLSEQLSALAASASASECKVLIARYRRMEWDYLRGDHALIFQRATREAQRLLHNKELPERSRS